MSETMQSSAIGGDNAYARDPQRPRLVDRLLKAWNACAGIEPAAHETGKANSMNQMVNRRAVVAASTGAAAIVFTGAAPSSAMAALPGAAALQQAGAAPEASPLVPDQARAPASPAAPVRDPLIDAIDRLRAAFDDFTRNAPLDNERRGAYATTSYGPPLEVLSAWDQPAVSKEGALAALRLAEEENREFACSPVAENMVAAALAYFEGEDAMVTGTKAPRSSLCAPADLARYHLQEYKRAAQAADPTITGWRRCTPEDDGDVAFWIYALRS